MEKLSFQSLAMGIMFLSPPLLLGLLSVFVVTSAYSIEVNSTPKPSNGVVAIALFRFLSVWITRTLYWVYIFCLFHLWDNYLRSVHPSSFSFCFILLMLVGG